MPASPFVSWPRVSTERQGRSGPGLEAQRRVAADLLAGAGDGRLVAEMVEIEGRARHSRHRLVEALVLPRLHDAILVVAKLDRPSRDAAFLPDRTASQPW